jgi:hypothetical protein
MTIIKIKAPKRSAILEPDQLKPNTAYLSKSELGNSANVFHNCLCYRFEDSIGSFDRSGNFKIYTIQEWHTYTFEEVKNVEIKVEA